MDESCEVFLREVGEIEGEFVSVGLEDRVCWGGDVGVVNGGGGGGAEGEDGGGKGRAGFVVCGGYGLGGEVGSLGDEVDVAFCEVPFTDGNVGRGVCEGSRSRAGATGKGILFSLLAF